MRRMQLLAAWLISVCLAIPIIPPPVSAPAAAAPVRHGMGLTLPGFGWKAAGAHPSGSALAALPASVDLGQYLPPIGDQGQVGSCASWASTYYMLGWWAKKLGYYPAFGFAPMYTYSRIVAQFDGGQDGGSTIEQPFQLLQQHGAPPESAYPQGYYDYKDLPTAAEDAAAAPYATGGYRTIWGYQSAQDPQVAIEAALAGGDPVDIGFLVYPEYASYGPASGPVPAPAPYEYPLGGHANVAYGYGPDGLSVQNQWGARWGHGGRAVLSWDYVRAAVADAAVLRVAGPAPVPATPTAAPTFPVLPTATAPISPTATPTPAPSATPAPPVVVPWPHPQAPALPGALPPGTYRVFLAVYDRQGHRRSSAVVTVTKR